MLLLIMSIPVHVQALFTHFVLIVGCLYTCVSITAITTQQFGIIYTVYRVSCIVYRVSCIVYRIASNMKGWTAVPLG